MKNRFIWVPMVLAVGMTACHPSAERIDGEGISKESSMEPVQDTDGLKKPDQGGSSGGGSGKPGTADALDGKKEEAGSAKEAARALSADELKDFEAYFSRQDNYGFLLSDYRTPEEINLDELLYSGAGMEQKDLTEEERRAFLKAAGQTEQITDLTRLTTAQIDTFLTQKMGITLNQAGSGLGWLYLPEYDCYYSEHGDTNMRSFFCIKGELDGDIYKIWCLSDGYSQFNLESIVTLKKTSEGLQYLSNEITWDNLGIYKAETGSPSVEALHFIANAYKNDAEGIASDSSSHIFDSDTRYFSKEELQELIWRPRLLSVFRNEIYARHGYIFNSGYWNGFFGKYDWYHGQYPADTFDTECFNEYEKANLKLAVETEK